MYKQDISLVKMTNSSIFFVTLHIEIDCNYNKGFIHLF